MLFSTECGKQEEIEICKKNGHSVPYQKFDIE
jgi:hypothetical protein